MSAASNWSATCFQNRRRRIAATTELVRKWISDPKVVELALSAANAHPGHASGRINTLVLLENVDLQVLTEYSSEVEGLLEKLRSEGGSQTVQRAEVVQGRLGALPSAH
jgi:hypothetical protein